ncbi:hypothetical protein EV421DRAFT_363555 [Armillaria borealis]|uniref:Uncharacterized protein n=1 Tax=Armillaria borealis TaxID=47425 RepID=A0AA39JLH9_9AGAR|nr:hypothetical protein EV421DRAFT_363555 [Armillaria borealis]
MVSIGQSQVSLIDDRRQDPRGSSDCMTIALEPRLRSDDSHQTQKRFQDLHAALIYLSLFSLITSYTLSLSDRFFEMSGFYDCAPSSRRWSSWTRAVQDWRSYPPASLNAEWQFDQAFLRCIPWEDHGIMFLSRNLWIFSKGDYISTCISILVRMPHVFHVNLHVPKVYHYRLLISPAPTMT